MNELAWNHQRARIANERVLWDLLWSGGPASRVHLAGVTGLSKPTVASVLDELGRHGLVRVVGSVAGDRGRAAVIYEADPTAGYVLGIDIGRARLRAAVADLSGQVLARADVPNRGRSAASVATDAVGAAGRALAQAQVEAGRVVHAAVGTPGVYDGVQGRVRFAGHLPGWGRTGLFDRIRQELGGVQMSVHNDANLAAIGEWAHGAGRGCRLFVYVLVGTGLGVGIVVDGEVFTGAGGAAGEVGLLPVSFVSADGATEQWSGALEEAVNADAVVRAGREHGMTGRLTAKRVFDEARSGRPGALEAVAVEAERLAQVVAAVSAVLDPERVVLGGGVGHGADLLLNPVRQALHKRTPLRPAVLASELGDDAVLLGAITMGLRRARPQVFDNRTTAGAAATPGEV